MYTSSMCVGDRTRKKRAGYGSVGTVPNNMPSKKSDLIMEPNLRYKNKSNNGRRSEIDVNLFTHRCLFHRGGSLFFFCC